MGQICDALNERQKGKLPSQPQQIQKSAFQESTSTCNESSHSQVNVVTTLRSGKVVDKNLGVSQSSESKLDSPMHTTPQKTPIVEKKSEHDSDSENSTDVNVHAPSIVPAAPFPQRLVQQKKGTKYNEMLEMFKRVNINIPFLEAIKQIPAYAKFLKDLCTQKRKLHVHKRAFLTEQLDLGEPKPTPVTLKLADISVKIPRGIVEDVLIKVEIFYFPMEFIVLYTQPVQNPNCHIPVILGCPFLVTSNAIINCRNGVLNLSFGNMNVNLNVFNIIQQPIECDDTDLHEINMIESLIQDSLPDILSVDLCKHDVVEPLTLSDSEATPSLEEEPKLDLKPLPDTLIYTFLGSSETLPVIIASCLETELESQLLEVFK
ncbi:uncharacterized protein LOC113311649 [Papaver somniferum]|uniref:uncharacterized protein LOC113311649 n=1 Tax=Papaver somniferum TaxID=3469 RepID=UPI000E6FDA6D|nr:uncharacterized protein LOC113311649 [Papaver somniferum]